MKILFIFEYISAEFIVGFFSFLSCVLVLSCVRLLDSTPHCPSHLTIVKGEKRRVRTSLPVYCKEM